MTSYMVALIPAHAPACDPALVDGAEAIAADSPREALAFALSVWAIHRLRTITAGGVTDWAALVSGPPEPGAGHPRIVHRYELTLTPRA